METNPELLGVGLGECDTMYQGSTKVAILLLMMPCGFVQSLGEAGGNIYGNAPIFATSFEFKLFQIKI